MGKFPASKLHDWYSDWHWKLREKNPKYSQLYLCDIDRFWVEVDFKNSRIWVFDIKREYDSVTATEKLVYEILKEKQIKVYVCYIDEFYKRFRVVEDDGTERTYSEDEFAEFLFCLRFPKYGEQFNMFHNNKN